MYTAYFGLREKPFKLVPNPEYLFLSKNHEIAMAHLTYATHQGEGFVVLAGEVGTGKTTLCRNYLEGLDENTESAYIFNPNLGYEQLLATICHEYGIEPGAQNAKVLLEKLYTFLIRKNSDDKKVVLVIDEAQSLSTENLELVRMLSNLETTRSKLLQIILVGQPELENKLESYELRQLAQRISLSYHLGPLSQKDTQAYIRHRLGVASQHRQAELFSTEVCRMAYRFSKGIPRLINIVCDRALLTAYSHNQSKVTKHVMHTAIGELLSRGKASPKNKGWTVFLGAGVCLLAIALAVMVMIMRSNYQLRLDDSGSRQAGTAMEAPPATASQTFKIPDSAKSGLEKAVPPKQAAPDSIETGTPSGPQAILESIASQQSTPSLDAAPETTSVSVAKPSTDPSDSDQGTSIPNRPGQALSFVNLIQQLEPESSRKAAVGALLSIWRQPRPDVGMIPVDVDDTTFFEIAARQYGLRNYKIHNTWNLLRQLDLPAVVALNKDATGHPVFLTLTKWQNQTIRIKASQDGPEVQTDFETIQPFLAGTAYVFWKNSIGYDMIINYGADSRAILAVKLLLRQVGYEQVALSPEFDEATRLAVLDFQGRHNIAVDGLVGALTKIMLLREAGTTTMPRLSAAGRARS